MTERYRSVAGVAVSGHQDTHRRAYYLAPAHYYAVFTFRLYLVMLQQFQHTHRRSR